MPDYDVKGLYRIPETRTIDRKVTVKVVVTTSSCRPGIQIETTKKNKPASDHGSSHRIVDVVEKHSIMFEL